MYVTRVKIKSKEANTTDHIFATAEITLSNGLILKNVFIVEEQNELSLDCSKMKKANKSPLTNNLQSFGPLEKDKLFQLLQPALEHMRSYTGVYRIDMLAKQQANENLRFDSSVAASYLTYANKQFDITQIFEDQLLEDEKDDIDQILAQLQDNESYSEEDIDSIVQLIIDTGGIERAIEKLHGILSIFQKDALDQ